MSDDTVRDDTVRDGPAAGGECRVLLVEDHELLAQSLAFAMNADGYEVRQAPIDSHDSILEAARADAYDVVLLDLDLGRELGSSLSLIRPLQGTGARVVMLTAVTDRERLAECIEAGAIGLVSKAASFEQLLDSVREAVDLGTLLSPGQRDQLLAELREQRWARSQRMAAFSQLTRREQELLGLLMQGRSAQEIADTWVVSITTVRSTIRSLLQKLDVHSQVAAIGLARRAGWTPPQA